MKNFTTAVYRTAVTAVCVALMIGIGTTAFAQVAPNLGTAATYGAFSGAGAIENTGLTVVHGDIGTYVGAFTGFPPGIYTGAYHNADAAALGAKNDLVLGYNSMMDAAHAIQFDTALNATMGNGQVLTSRTYGRNDLTTIEGELTFDAKGNNDAIFIVKIRAALNVSANTKILLAGGAQAKNIFWAVDGAVSILDNTDFKGTIVSNGAIHLYGGSTLDGRALAVVGAVTLASNLVTGLVVVPPTNTLTIITPAPGDSVKGGKQGYEIKWAGTGIAATKTIAYSLDSGLTWKDIATITTANFTYSWNVPDTVSVKALVRVTDANDLRGVSGIFKITAMDKLVIVTPIAGESIQGNTKNYQIKWSGTGIAALKTIEYSLDSGATWKPVAVITTALFSYSWNVPDTVSTKARVRITDGAGVRAVSGVFTITTSKIPGTIRFVRPFAGEVLIGGTQGYAVMWSATGLTRTKTLEYSLDSGKTWTTIVTMSNDTVGYAWNVPDVASTTAMLRLTDSSGATGKSAVFTIKSSSSSNASIIIVHPAAGEVLSGGSVNYPITFTATNTTLNKRFEYSLDAGITWNLIEIYSSDIKYYMWSNVPNEATTTALIRITDDNGVMGVSGLFTINVVDAGGSIDGLVLSGLDIDRNIAVGGTIGISWSFTPDIGTSVEVEYSLDASGIWYHIATMPVTETPFVSWTTPSDGPHNPAFIRVRSTRGMVRVSKPFTIGVTTSVADEQALAGYTVTNSPNPAYTNAQIAFTIPSASDVQLTIVDARGIEVAQTAPQRYEAGTSTLLVNTSGLIPGMYVYTLQAGPTRMMGRMIISK